MAAIDFNQGLYQLLKQGADNVTVKMVLCGTGNNCASHKDTDAVSGITLDEHDGANYSQDTGYEVAVTAAVNDTHDCITLDFDDDYKEFAALGNGTRQIEGFLYMIWNSTVDDSYPLAWRALDIAMDPNGEDFRAMHPEDEHANAALIYLDNS